MTAAELAELIRNGEDSTLEFKRDDVRNHDLAKELVAFLNLDGGIVLLGVEDNGCISGTTRDRLEDWVSDLCRVKIAPAIVPLLSWARNVEPDRRVLAVLHLARELAPRYRARSGQSPPPNARAASA